MKASETPLQPVLEGSKQYLVPLFQRHYSWTKTHWQALWDDLTELYEADDGREHFLGAIVNMPVETLPEGVNKLLLIDGQQRLTTLLILMAAMRDLVVEEDSKLAEQLNEQYLINKWAQGINRFKLLPTQGDREDFFKIVNGDNSGRSRLIKAYRYFTRKLRGRDVEGKPFDHRQLHALLIQRFVVVNIVLAKDENAYVIFESLNAKGQPLTQADLVRNYLFMRITDEGEQHTAYDELWRPMEKMLDGELTNFLWRYLTKDGTFVRQSSIYEAIKNRLSALHTSHEVVDEMLDMYTFAGYYKRLIDPGNEPDREIRRRLERINRWETKTSYPFLLALYQDYEQGRLSSEQICSVLDTIESFVVRRFIGGVPTNNLNRIFIALYNSLNKSDLVGSTNAQLATRRWPSDEQFLRGWQNHPIYKSGRDKTRHILESLESSLTSNNEPVDVSFHKITIEHVMPQTLNEPWEEMLGEDADQVHKSFLHTIGNLSLTGKNEPMGNSPFVAKREVFSKSNFALNKSIAERAHWDAGAIKERAQFLGKVAVQIWPAPDIDTRERDNDPTGYKPTHFTLFETEYSARTWREVLLKGCELLADLHGQDDFAARTASVAGSKRQYISYVPDGMKVPNRIKGTKLYVETNLSSRHILSLIDQIMRACGHDETEFEAYW